MGGTRERQVALATLVLALASAAAACDPAVDEVRADEALAFYQQMSAAGERAVTGVAQFTAPDGVLDARATAGRWVEGRDEQQRVLAMWFGQTMGEVGLERVYVDADQALVLYRQAPTRAGAGAGQWMALDTVGTEGITHREVLISCQGDGEVPDSPRMSEAERLARDHLDLWAGGSTATVDDVYATDAVVHDTLLGLVISGRDAIAASAPADEPWRPAGLSVSGVAPVFLHQTSPYVGDLTRVVSLVTTGSGSSLAIDLAVDESGHVTRERRFHAADALPPSAASVSPWWTGVTPPPRPSGLPAVDLATLGGTVEVRGADQATLDRLAWAFHRFDLAGLPPPRVTSIVVDTYGPDCEKASGVARLSGRAASLTICPNAAALCESTPCTHPRAYPSQSILHELAHAWMADNLADARRARLLTAAGLSTWDDRESAWAARGEEVAAETLSWGLMDVPVALHRLGDPDPRALADWFRLLTDREPLVPWLEAKDHLP